MLYKRSDSAYFRWLCSKVYEPNDRISYDKLLEYLYEKEFTWIMPMDENRALDGIDLRSDYLDLYPNHDLDNRSCSILEMMIALSIRCEEHIMSDDCYGNRTGEWFWNMILSLGLNTMTDDKFDVQYVDEVLFIFTTRSYRKNGSGGLFTINNPDIDMRGMDIWYQLNWYLEEV